MLKMVLSTVCSCPNKNILPKDSSKLQIFNGPFKMLKLVLSKVCSCPNKDFASEDPLSNRCLTVLKNVEIGPFLFLS